MKKLILLPVALLIIVSGYAKRKSVFPLDVNDKVRTVKNVPKFNADPCLDAALNAQANAFYAEYVGHNFCANSVSNGSIAISEYGGCCYAFTSIRQAAVSYIQSSFVPCPSGAGVGIAKAGQVKKLILAKA